MQNSLLYSRHKGNNYRSNFYYNQISQTKQDKKVSHVLVMENKDYVRI
jgi:hypothetical protein